MQNVPEIYPYTYSCLRAHPEEKRVSYVNRLRSKVMPYRFEAAAREICTTLRIKTDSRVLEVGCGLGLLGAAICKRVNLPKSNYTGIDILKTSAQKAHQELDSTITADVQKLPFPDNSFDYVVSTDVLEHVTDAKTVAREIYRVLAPNGVAFLVIADPSEGRFAYVNGHIKRSDSESDVQWWESLFDNIGFELVTDHTKIRNKDWRKIFNLPVLSRLKDKPGFSCAFNPVHRPGVYVLKKTSIN